jgi:hypothetical protein
LDLRPAPGEGDHRTGDGWPTSLPTAVPHLPLQMVRLGPQSFYVSSYSLLHKAFLGEIRRGSRLYKFCIDATLFFLLDDGEQSMSFQERQRTANGEPSTQVAEAEQPERFLVRTACIELLQQTVEHRVWRRHAGIGHCRIRARIR